MQINQIQSFEMLTEAVKLSLFMNGTTALHLNMLYQTVP